jgi:hypothetical protein
MPGAQGKSLFDSKRLEKVLLISSLGVLDVYKIAGCLLLRAIGLQIIRDDFSLVLFEKHIYFNQSWIKLINVFAPGDMCCKDILAMPIVRQ